MVNPLSANPTKWSNTLKQFVGKLPTDFLSVFDHFVGIVLKGLIRNAASESILTFNENGLEAVCQVSLMQRRIQNLVKRLRFFAKIVTAKSW